MIMVTLIISQLLVNIWMFYAKVRAANLHLSFLTDADACVLIGRQLLC